MQRRKRWSDDDGGGHRIGLDLDVSLERFFFGFPICCFLDTQIVPCTRTRHPELNSIREMIVDKASFLSMVIYHIICLFFGQNGPAPT